MMKRALIVVLLLLVATTALARVGGGESYSGGGGSGGGGGGDGDGIAYLIFRFLLWLTIEHPLIGIPVDILVIVIVIRWRKKGERMKETTVLSVATVPQPAARLDALRRFDPNFSEIVFADFCYSLYARAHHARGAKDLKRYTLYLSDAARQALAGGNPQGLTEVRGIVIGAFRITAVRGLDSPQVSVTVAYESNMTEVYPERSRRIAGGTETSWYCREQWLLERKRDILSPPPEKAKADHCPRCGAPLETRTDGACNHCGVRIDDGAFYWFVRSITVLAKEARGPLLTSNVPEQGTDRPTFFQHHFGERRRAFEAEHPDFDWNAFLARVREIAVALQDAWTAREWESVRPLETDNLFQMHRYWIDAYRHQRLRNVVDDFTIARIEPVKIDADAFYEAITVRIFARGRDHTVDESGRVVAGSKDSVRAWSEYWTFIRHRAAKAGAQTISCPNCGAPVAVGATGVCPFCGGKLTSGEFDWVLSRIEQDDAYRG